MEISQQTADELKAQKQKEYEEWNKKINESAEEIIELLRAKQFSILDAGETIKIVGTILGSKTGSLNINYVLNNNK